MKYIYQIINLCWLFASASAFSFEDVDFDRSNGFDLMHKYSVRYKETDADIKIKLLKENYERLKPSKISLNPAPIIQKKLFIKYG